MWLVADRVGGSLLAQYDRTTYRASIVDVGRFSSSAFLVADRSSARVFVIEPHRVLVIDERVQPLAVPMPAALTLSSAYAADGMLLVCCARTRTDELEAVLYNSRTGETVRTFLLGQQWARNWSVNHMAVSRDAQRLYIAYAIGFQQHYVDLYSLSTRELLARAPNAYPQAIFQLDESRGVVISDQQAPFNGPLYYLRAFQVRDARTLTLLREFGLGLFEQLRRFTFAQTGDAIVVYSERAISSLFDEGCHSYAPRITLFDRSTFTAVRQIDLQGHCPFLVQLPAR